MPIAVNGSGTITGISVGGLPDGIVDADMLASNAVTAGKLASGVGGKILQVVQTFKNDTASTNSGTFADISGFTVSITPSSTSSKILYTGSLYLSSTSSEAVFRLKRTIGGTATNISVSSVLDDTNDGSFVHGGGSRKDGHAWEFLDSPNTTSAITYGISWRVHSGTTYLNRTWDAGAFHGASAITVMEVAA
jgi:hypothetical protein